MSVGLLFWILYIVGLIFYGVDSYRSGAYSIPSVLFWVLIALLGYGTFGGPIK